MVRGHDVSGCMRWGASLSAEKSTEISSLKNELSAMKKSIEGVTGLQDSVDSLQMNSLLAWQADVVNPQLHRVRENAEEIQLLKKQVGQLREWRPTVESRMDSGMQRSQFDEWLEQSFEPVRLQASYALPRSEFDEYVAGMEETESQLKVRASRVRVDRNAATGDTGMTPEKTIGNKRNSRESTPEGDGPAEAVKRRHRGPPATPATPAVDSTSPRASSSTPGADAFARIHDGPKEADGPRRELLGRSLEMWQELPPTPKSAWSEQAFDVLLSEWGVEQDVRLQGWVKANCGEEMITTVDGLVAGSLTDQKKQGIKSILNATRMPPRAFTGP